MLFIYLFQHSLLVIINYYYQPKPQTSHPPLTQNQFVEEIPPSPTDRKSVV